MQLVLGDGKPFGEVVEATVRAAEVEKVVAESVDAPPLFNLLLGALGIVKLFQKRVIYFDRSLLMLVGRPGLLTYLIIAPIRTKVRAPYEF